MTNKSLQLILIHGAGGSKDKWRDVLPLLASEDVVAIDLPGHGENQQPAKESIEALVEEVAQSITTDCIVAGHSLGGLVALELAHRNEYVQAAVFVASSYELPVHPKIIDSLAEGVYPEFLFKASFGKEADSELLEEELAQVNAFPTEIAKMDFQACADYKSGEKVIKELDKPVLAILGEEDKLVPKGTPEILPEINPSVAIQMIPGAGHYNLLETPEKVAAALLHFKKAVETEK